MSKPNVHYHIKMLREAPDVSICDPEQPLSASRIDDLQRRFTKHSERIVPDPQLAGVAYEDIDSYLTREGYQQYSANSLEAKPHRNGAKAYKATTSYSNPYQPEILMHITVHSCDSSFCDPCREN